MPRKNEHVPRNLPHRDVERRSRCPEPLRDLGQEEPAQHRVHQDLEDGVDRDQHGRDIAVAAGQLVPDQHHRDTAGQPDQDQPVAVGGLVRQERPGQPEHQQRANHPVQHHREAEQPSLRLEPAQGFVSTLASTGYIIQSRPIAIGSETPATLTRSSDSPRSGKTFPSPTERHRQQDPERQEPVDDRQASLPVDGGSIDGAALPHDRRSRWMGGHGTDPYVQKTQQSPARLQDDATGLAPVYNLAGRLGHLLFR